jgi:hypothetical protein
MHKDQGERVPVSGFGSSTFSLGRESQATVIRATGRGGRTYHPGPLTLSYACALGRQPWKQYPPTGVGTMEAKKTTEKAVGTANKEHMDRVSKHFGMTQRSGDIAESKTPQLPFNLKKLSN